MSIQKLFASLIAVSVMLAPTLARAGEAYVAAPNHQMQMMEAGHCKSSPSGTQDNSGTHDKSMAKSCCIAMCMALAVVPSAPAHSRMPARIVTIFLAPSFRIGLPAEIATPPPRLA